MKEFPKFWYESNACWGYVSSIEELQEKCDLQTDPIYGGLRNKDEFLDNSKVNSFNETNYGTRIEHYGDKTLREFLIENDVDVSKLK